MSLQDRLAHRFQRQIVESSALFLNILRWTFLAAIVGVIVGASTGVFILILHRAMQFMERFPYFFLAIPLGLWFSSWFIKLLAPQAAGHGTEKVIEAVHNRSGRMNPWGAPVKLIATVITIASGGSAGKEGPAAQIGATLASLFADLTRLSDRDRRKLVICGISAGFAAVFSTPIAGSLFGVEVLFLGQILYDVLLPSFIAGITAVQVSKWMGVGYFWQQLTWTPEFSQMLFLQVIVSGAVFGLVSIAFIEALRWGHLAFKAFDKHPHFKPFYGGIILISLGLLLGTGGLGLGVETLRQVLEGGDCPWWLWLFKSTATGVTLGCGGSGGVITPIFLVGASAGSAWGSILGLDPAIFAALGMIAVLAGTTNAPIAAAVMGLELFGPNFGLYGAIVCVVSFLMTGYRGVYSSQILARQKSEILHAPLNQPIPSEGDAVLEFSTRKRIAVWRHFFKDLRRKIRRITSKITGSQE
ncbi:MAG: chloride channel protein [bacterium]